MLPPPTKLPAPSAAAAAAASADTALLTPKPKYERLDNNGDDDSPEESAAGKRKSFVNRGVKACTIQRLFKRHRFVFGKLGPTIFARKGGYDADYGVLHFPSSNVNAQFVTVADSTSAPLFANFMEKHWKLRRPEVVISVTGGAQDFRLSPRLQEVFDRGLVSAAASTNAWVVTGGTDTGVMKLVGSAFHAQSVAAPLIGVVPYGCVKGRDLFDGSQGETVTYSCTEKAGVDGAPLNPYHTHFVLVDNGKVAPQAWGAEIGMRANLETTYTGLKGVPMVLLVVQGGPGTLQTVASFASNHQAILVVRDSGGAADAIYDYVHAGKTQDPKFQAEKLQATLAQIKQLHLESGERVLSFFSLHDHVEMSTVLLRALVRILVAPAPAEGGVRKHDKSSEHEKNARALVLAVNWNRVDVARDLLRDMSAERRFTFGHHVALQFMLERHRVELFKVIAECPAFKIERINLARLYMNTQVDKYGIIGADRALQRRFASSLKEISSVDRDADHQDDPLDTFYYYRRVVGLFLEELSHELSISVLTSNTVKWRDLFLWAVVVGDDAFIYDFWKRTDNPVRVALWGAHVSRQIALRTQFGTAECLERANRLQGWAIDLLDVVPMAAAHRILGHAVHEWGPNTLIDMAMQFEMKQFLAHRHCQSLMDLWWRGGVAGSKMVLGDGTEMLTLWLYVLVPVLNPYLYKAAEIADESAEKPRDFSALTDAVMYTYRLAKVEIANASGHPVAMGSPSARARMQRISMVLGEQNKKEQENGAEAGGERSGANPLTRLVSFYTIANVKLVVRATMHVIMLANYFQLLYTIPTIREVRITGVPSIMLPEYVFYFQAFANLSDQVGQAILLEQRKIKRLDNFGKLLAFGDRLLVFAFVLRMASVILLDHSSEVEILLYVGSQVTLCFDVIIISIRTITFRAVSEKFGVLVIMFERMSQDLILFMELFFLIMSGFALCFVGMASWSSTPSADDATALHPLLGPNATESVGARLSRMLRARDNDEGIETRSHYMPWMQAIIIAFWGMYGEVDTDFFEEKVPFGQPVLWLWVLFSSIVLVNLLVAMFADTYNKILTQSTVEYQFQRYNRVFLYNNIIQAIPPPFNVLMTVPQLVWHYVSVCVQRYCCWFRGKSNRPSAAYMATAKTMADDRHRDHVASSSYMETYLRRKDEKEAESAYGVSLATRGGVRIMVDEQARQAEMLDLLQQRQATQMQLLTDIQTQLKAATQLQHDRSRLTSADV